MRDVWHKSFTTAQEVPVPQHAIGASCHLVWVVSFSGLRALHIGFLSSLRISCVAEWAEWEVVVINYNMPSPTYMGGSG